MSVKGLIIFRYSEATVKVVVKEMSSKKLINNPNDCVDQALEGLVMTHSGLRILGNQRVIVQDSVRIL